MISVAQTFIHPRRLAIGAILAFATNDRISGLVGLVVAKHPWSNLSRRWQAEWCHFVHQFFSSLTLVSPAHEEKVRALIGGLFYQALRSDRFLPVRLDRVRIILIVVLLLFNISVIVHIIATHVAVHEIARVLLKTSRSLPEI